MININIIKNEKNNKFNTVPKTPFIITNSSNEVYMIIESEDGYYYSIDINTGTIDITSDGCSHSSIRVLYFLDNLIWTIKDSNMEIYK